MDPAVGREVFERAILPLGREHQRTVLMVRHTAHTAMAYIVMACIVIACTIVARTDKAYIVMAYIVIASTIVARTAKAYIGTRGYGPLQLWPT